MLDSANALPLGSDKRGAELQKAASWAIDRAWQFPICFLTVQWVADKNISGINAMPPWNALPWTRYWSVGSGAS
jgi:hypothetical protein